MRKLVKLKVILLAFTFFFTSQLLAVEIILPLPKPNVEKEIKIKAEKKKQIYPEKKPRLQCRALVLL